MMFFCKSKKFVFLFVFIGSLSNCLLAVDNFNRDLFFDFFLGHALFSNDHKVQYFSGLTDVESVLYELDNGSNVQFGLGYKYNDSYSFEIGLGRLKSSGIDANFNLHSKFKSKLDYWLFGASINLPFYRVFIPYVNASLGISNVQQESYLYSINEKLSGYYNAANRTSFISSAKIGVYFDLNLPFLLEYKFIYLPNNLSERANVERGNAESFLSNISIKSDALVVHSVVIGLRLYL